MARPTEYTEEIGIEICTQIAEGKALTTICKAENMPAVRSVYYWLNQHEEFLQTYARAKEDQADTLVDEMLNIADEECTTIKHVEGDNEKEIEVTFDSVAVARNRLRVDTRKWIASKLKAKKYGDKLDVDANVKSSVTIVATPLDEQI